MDGLVFGIELGTGSCGWAVLRTPKPERPDGGIVAMGTWMFDVPETAERKSLTTQVRRNHRLARRLVRRKAQRMAQIRLLFAQHGLLEGHNRDALKLPSLDPWELRARGLDELLSPAELAVALGHIAKRRGFKSVWSGRTNQPASADQAMLKTLEEMRTTLAQYRSTAEMFAHHPDYRDRKRNREGLFDRTQNRDDLVREVGELFRAQRRHGNVVATPELEAKFAAIAFLQRERQRSATPFSTCRFEPKERRTTKFSPSLERLRLLDKLVKLRIATGNGDRSLTTEEIRLASADLGRTAKLSIKEVRKRIGLPAELRFTEVSPEAEAQDIVHRSGEALHGTKRLRDALGEALWAELQNDPVKLDRIADAMSFYDMPVQTEAELKKIGLPEHAVEALLSDPDEFSRFGQAGHLSTKAALALINHLERGLQYHDACQALGYDHLSFSCPTRTQVTDKASFNGLLEELGLKVNHPVARKSLTEGLKQLWALRNKWGLPDAIHIQLTNEFGRSLAERNAIKHGLDKIAAKRERQRAEVRKLLDIKVVCSDTLQRYRLWKEQYGRCPYTDKVIPVTAIRAADPNHQVCHILPWSRFTDDSFSNKALCTAEASQSKKHQTPFEWFMAVHGEGAWTAFRARIEANPALQGAKKRNFVLENTERTEERWRRRNLRDTRYAADVLMGAAALFYPEAKRRLKAHDCPVITRPRALTSALSNAWGLETLKRTDNRHDRDARQHALNALTVAATGTCYVERLVQFFQEHEQQGLGGSLRSAVPPWGNAASFRRAAKRAFGEILVVWPERRRARGAGHAATIRRVRTDRGDPIVYERKLLADLSEKRLEDIPNPERNHEMIETIRSWIAKGKPTDNLPRSPAGHEIRKVRLRTNVKPAVNIRGGTAERGKVVRVDVFMKRNRRGKAEFYLVPVYPHQVMNKKQWPFPPMRAVVAHRDEEDWPLIDDSFAFKFSLHPRSYVEVVKASGETLAGYFRGLNRSTGAIALLNDRDPTARTDVLGNSPDGIGTKTLLNIRKYVVDRHGTRFEVLSEARTWHGMHISSSPA